MLLEQPHGTPKLATLIDGADVIARGGETEQAVDVCVCCTGLVVGDCIVLFVYMQIDGD
jgi:hypothetical protein